MRIGSYSDAAKHHSGLLHGAAATAGRCLLAVDVGQFHHFRGEKQNAHGVLALSMAAAIEGFLSQGLSTTHHPCVGVARRQREVRLDLHRATRPTRQLDLLSIPVDL